MYNSSSHLFFNKCSLITLLVLWMQICLAQNRIKKTDYDYDLISGNVRQVIYQANRPEVFVQEYKYDADNRITEVRSSTDGVIFNRDAAYSYYQHGPLSRTVLGDNNVQGLDYVYTIHGWLKAVNSNVLDPSKDPGKDGQIGSKLARDVVGYSLGYYQNDYTSIGGSMQFLSIITPTDLDVPGSSLYNGNIRHMITSLTDNTGTQLDVQGNAYRYDQLNRIKQSELFVLNKVTNSFAGAGPSTKYKENFSYDANGNITGLTRNGNAATRLMDQLTYRYAEEGGKKVNNRLLHVKDDALTATYSNDINDQGTYAANDVTTWNYRYDAIGNLIYDRQSGIEEINWNVGGKIKSIHGIVDSARSDIEFKYDALGHRIAKIVKPFDHLTDPSFWIYTYYILDAKGNTLAAYEKKFEGGELKIRLKEQYTYGSKRLGSVQRDLDVTDPYLPMPNATPTFERILGKRQYELSNHLGNVLAVISDKRTAHITPGGVPDYYLAQVSSATDYYAFGSPMPGRDFVSDGYRYGFNGMEKDNEVKGNGNSYTTEFRQYDSRLGRWLSLDPKMTNFADMAPYAAFSNNPIFLVDPLGDAPSGAKELGKLFESQVLDKLTDSGVEFIAQARIHMNIDPQRPYVYSFSTYTDFIVKTGDGSFEIIETKLSSGTSYSHAQSLLYQSVSKIRKAGGTIENVVTNSRADIAVKNGLRISPKLKDFLGAADSKVKVSTFAKYTRIDGTKEGYKTLEEVIQRGLSYKSATASFIGEMADNVLKHIPLKYSKYIPFIGIAPGLGSAGVNFGKGDIAGGSLDAVGTVCDVCEMILTPSSISELQSPPTMPETITEEPK